MIPEEKLSDFIAVATTHGASHAAIIPAGDIVSDEGLAALCNGEVTCPNFGLAASCPPHVKGPGQFRQWQAQCSWALVVKIELPADLLFSDGRNQVMQLLHQIVALVEITAIGAGFPHSKGFAGGSCKTLFCPDQPDCAVVSGNLPCRHSHSARPSMSGFGVDVARLMASCGWHGAKADPADASQPDALSWVAGLVLIG